MKKLTFWSVLIAASIMVAIYIVWLEPGLSGDLLAFVIPQILGVATGLVAIPAILVGVLILVAKAFRHSFKNATIFAVTGVLWLILVIANINVALFEQSAR